jgi:hypothetical protein
VARLESPLIPPTIVRLGPAVGRLVDHLAHLGRIKLAAVVALAAGNLCAVLQPGLSVGAVLTQAAVAGFACYLPLLLCALTAAVARTLTGRRAADRTGS